MTIVSCQMMFAQHDRHVLLISIDGLRPDFYLGEEWDTPTLKSLMKTGVYADGINSVFPSVTYPSHTSIVSGAFPDKHGIFYNVPRTSKDSHWNWEYERIRTRTLWDAAEEKGLTTGAVMWPVTVGAPITYNFPVRRPYGNEKGDQLTVTTPVVTPADLMPRMRSAGVVTSGEQFRHENVDQTIGEMARYIIKNHHPVLMAVHFINVDHVQHVHGRDNIYVKEAVRNVDNQIEKLIAVLKETDLYDRTDIIVTGDHGHVDVDKVFSPNILLKKAGLISADSWKARFATAGGAAFLYVKEDRYAKQVEKILGTLPDAQRQLFTVYSRDDLNKIGADPDAALALGMKKGYVANSGLKGKIVKDRKPVAAHGFYPDFKEIQTGFIISGPGVAGQNRKIDFEMGIQDIAPLISRLLDLGLHVKDGVFHDGILRLKQ
ncbi:alkaline phosphatase family protein [Sinomicrobium soli]|uniref:alkaline phosphatase family protein n=1 Tax=Sinomicrobium sp. N-1-3-6 TaxID=2219864 RepID=UPI001374C92C|nr:ectonucleotide pyrophosphatase/phosphodiesterase [Sinomicrobium sp. N-1-3-6]